MSVSSENTNAELLSQLLDDVASVPDEVSVMTDLRDYDPGARDVKIRRCLLTLYTPDLSDRWLDPLTYYTKPEDKINIWVGQFEVCPSTARDHIQLYVEFSQQFRFQTIKKVFETRLGANTCDIRKPKRASNHQRACAVNYCLKPDSRNATKSPMIWPGNKIEVHFDPDLYKQRKSASKRSEEKEAQVAWIESKPMHWTWEQIVHESMESKLLLAACSWGSKFHYGRPSSQPRRTIKNVVIFYGAGGTGKTSMAQAYDIHDGESADERYYKRNSDDGKFWGGGKTGYRGQRIIHLEEFCGQETAAAFKEICDVGKTGPGVNIKNSGGYLNHDTVIITSNHHPAQWYHKLCTEDSKQWAPLVRRFTKVFFFPAKRADGSINAPDTHNPPFWIDQTDDFQNLKDYPSARQHASEHWPLPSSATGFYDPNHSDVPQSTYQDFVDYCRTNRQNRH